MIQNGKKLCKCGGGINRELEARESNLQIKKLNFLSELKPKRKKKKTGDKITVKTRVLNLTLVTMNFKNVPLT